MKQKISSAVEESLDQEIEAVEKTSEGLIHETYSIRVAGDDYIIQFSGASHEDHSALRHCLEMYRFLENSDIPVPEPVTEEPRKIHGEGYVIVEKLPGENMETDVDKQKIREAGKMLAKIHRVKSFPHEGWLEIKDGDTEVYSFDEGDLDGKKKKERDGKLKTFSENGMDDLAERAREFLENYSEIPVKDFEAVLCHDDFSPDNVIWQDGIKGVIDFDYAFSGSAERNMVKSANAFWMHDPGTDDELREVFYRGYQQEREVREDFEQLEAYYRVETLVWLISGMMELDELDESEKEFYAKEISGEIERSEEILGKN